MKKKTNQATHCGQISESATSSERASGETPEGSIVTEDDSSMLVIFPEDLSVGTECRGRRQW